MAALVLRRSWFERFAPLSVVYLAVAYAVLTSALAVEWGRIFAGMADEIELSASSSESAIVGDQP